jgi:hypothetical protein
VKTGVGLTFGFPFVDDHGADPNHAKLADTLRSRKASHLSVLFVSVPVSYTVIKVTPASTNPDGDFLLRWNRNGMFDLICFRCWLTIGTTLPGSDSDADLKALRQEHVCDRHPLVEGG